MNAYHKAIAAASRQIPAARVEASAAAPAQASAAALSAGSKRVVALSLYEEKRLANIARNQEQLRELGLG